MSISVRSGLGNICCTFNLFSSDHLVFCSYPLLICPYALFSVFSSSCVKFIPALFSIFYFSFLIYLDADSFLLCFLLSGCAIFFCVRLSLISQLLLSLHLSPCLFARLSLVPSASYSLVIVHSLLSLPSRTSFKHSPLTSLHPHASPSLIIPESFPSLSFPLHRIPPLLFSP